MIKNIAILNETNKVINIIVVNDDYKLNQFEIEYFDNNPAYIGGDYVDGYFYSPQYYSSWSRDGKGNWNPPTPRPTEGFWSWDESSLSWVESTIL